MAAFAAYTDVQARLGITMTSAEQTRAGTLLDLATSLIQDAAGQTISAVANEALTLNGSYSNRVRLPERPVTNVDSVVLDGTTLIEDTDWYLDGDEIVRLTGSPVFGFGSGWGSPDQDLVVTYDHGYSTIPGSVKAVCVEMVVRAWTNPGSVMAEQYGTEQITYQRANGLLLTADEQRAVREAVRREAGSVTLR